MLQTAGEQGYCSMGGSASPFLLATAYPPGWGQGGHGWPVTAEKVVCVDKLRALLLTGDAYGTVICVHLARGHFSPMLRPELVSLLHKPPLGEGAQAELLVLPAVLPRDEAAKETKPRKRPSAGKARRASGRRPGA